MSSSNEELASYLTSCHCGAVTFTIRTPSLSYHQANRCDCSICSRNGYLLIHLKRADVDFQTGLDDMVSYSFGEKGGAHKFCPRCGSSVMIGFNGSDDSELWINARLIQGIDLQKLTYKDLNGKATQPIYKAPQIATTPNERSAASNFKRYNANCHCGTVTYTVHIPSLSDHEVNSCNCSICSLNGYLLVYPERKDVVFYSGYDHLSNYAFGRKIVSHKFCPTCGSSIMIDLNGFAPIGVDPIAINVRMIQDIDLSKLKFRYTDGKILF